MKWERFPRAPIAEALLDLQVTFPSPVDPARLLAFHEGLREGYPKMERRGKWRAGLLVGPEVVQQAVARGSEGFMFRSGDDQRIVQVRQDGYAFNWLKPYESWRALRDEARTYWERYRDFFRPHGVTRLGLRYINRLELPLPFTDFREFVTTAPDIAAALPQGLSGFFMRLEIPHPQGTLLAIVTETMQAPIDDGRRLPFIFDIDIVQRETVDPGEQAIWDTFEAMREYKNEIFFESMTARAKDLFR